MNKYFMVKPSEVQLKMVILTMNKNNIIKLTNEFFLWLNQLCIN
jgi:hypothetical protein